MKKILALLLLPLLLTGCSADDAAYIQSDQVLTVKTEGMDTTTNAVAVMEFEHHTIHDGVMFTVLEVTDLGNGAVRDVLLVSPNTAKWAHLVWEIEHELETTIQFYRGTTVTNNGTPISSFNRNGNSSITATTLVFHSPTIANVGTLIGTIQQGNGKKAGGSDRESNEFILRQNTSYLIRITNLTADNNLVFMKLNWYEHTNLGE